jgi:hypothetical protein
MLLHTGRTLIFLHQLALKHGIRDKLEKAFLNPIRGLYTDNATAPLGEGAGLRRHYEFGLYSYCGYTNDTAGICSNQTVGRQFTPYDILTSDMGFNYSQNTDAIFADGGFRESEYLGSTSKAAYWLLLIGTVLSFLTLITYVGHIAVLRQILTHSCAAGCPR